jgi:hypothetical protein
MADPSTITGEPPGGVAVTVSPLWKPLPATVSVCASALAAGADGEMEVIDGGGATTAWTVKEKTPDVCASALATCMLQVPTLFRTSVNWKLVAKTFWMEEPLKVDGVPLGGVTRTVSPLWKPAP